NFALNLTRNAEFSPPPRCVRLAWSTRIFPGGPMKVATLAALALAALASSASAQTIGGRYQVAGKNFNGSNYSGTAEIVSTSNNPCPITCGNGKPTPARH